MWMGTLNFGLVSMPVKLYAATTSKTVHFCQLHAGDNVRVQTKRYCPADEAEVSFDEVVRGYEIAPERYVVIEEMLAAGPAVGLLLIHYSDRHANHVGVAPRVTAFNPADRLQASVIRDIRQ